MNAAITKILEGNDKNKIRELFAFNKDYEAKIIQKKFAIWAKYYFPKFFSSPDAQHHRDMDMQNIEIYQHGGSFMNVAYRGSAKTTRTKLFIAFAIANDFEHHRRYFKVNSKEISNARQSVTDVYNLLISKRIKDIYPEVFEKSDTKREEQMGSFTTATGIKFVADSIGTDQRGDIQDEARPDFLWFDDFETRMTLTSAPVTFKIWNNMEEARTGLAKDGGAVYTCNYISERGNVHKLLGKIDNQLIVPIAHKVDGKWIPTWERFTADDVAKIEREADDFVGEYLCKPSASKDVYFDRDSVDRQVAKEPLDEIAGLKIFKKYNPSNRVGSGHDVGGGVGLDSSASVFIDFDQVPAQVIATYKNNTVPPDLFAYEIKKQCARFGENYCGVEKNYGSTLDILKTIYPTDKIHKTRRDSVKISFLQPNEFGWETNVNTKMTGLATLAQAIENGWLELNDADLISEFRSFSVGDLMDKSVDVRMTTRHWDLLMACMIAYQMNQYIPKPNTEENYPFLTNMGERPSQNKAR